MQDDFPRKGKLIIDPLIKQDIAGLK